MICPKCKTEYSQRFTKCSNCGEDLIENDVTQKGDREKWLLKFGETTAKRAISALFYLGLFPLFFTSILFGKYLYLTNTYEKAIWFIENGQKMYTSALVNNQPLGFLGGLVFFVVTALVWKVLCELLIIIFRAIETYIQKNLIQ
jgi:hypothetical protein